MSTEPVKLTAEEWETLIGNGRFFKMSSACECGPSWDRARMTAARALNAAVNTGLIPMPQEQPVIADCEECGPVRFLDEGYCDRCCGPVVMR